MDESWKNLGFKQADTHPVVNVSWNDANAFCDWLTRKDLAEGKIKAGQFYRLPTDVEWSVAVGLGKEQGNTPKEKDKGIKDVFPWGKEWPPPKGAGNYGVYEGSLKVDKFKYTSPVGSFAANKLGLYDMGGNALEWCLDKYTPTSANRVMRGASWDAFVGRNGSISGMLSAERHIITTFLRSTTVIGFRCVLAGGSGG